MSTTNELQVLGPEYVEESARVMADAFRDAHIYHYIFRGTPEFRRAALEWLFIRNIRIVLGKCPGALRGILNEENEVICCFMWVPQEHQDISLGEMLWHGIWQMPLWFGRNAVKRMLQVMDDLETFDKDCIGKANETRETKIIKEGSIHLQRMVVRPHCQGQGLGSKALKAVIAEESAKGSVNVHLETQSPRNVPFYGRLGFKVIYDRDCYEEEEEYKFHSWYMVLADEY